MGVAEWLGFKPKPPFAQLQSPSAPQYELIPEGMSLDEYLTSSVLNKPVEKLWREQPHLRTVVGFVARNIAQLGLHVFERDTDDGRNRLRDTPLEMLLGEPNDDTTTFELIEATVASRMLYDDTYWYVTRDMSAPSTWAIRHIPTPWIIGTIGAGAFNVQAYKMALPTTPQGNWLTLPADDVIMFRGWNPQDPKVGVSPVHALKAILAEQIHAAVFRDQMWQRGGRVAQYIYRPAEAQWSEEARTKWIQQYRQSYSGDQGSNAGGEPLLEDGMELRSNRFPARQEQFVESAKLSLETCSQVYYLNPAMVGILDNANYSNVREFRQMLYNDSLGPEIERMQQRINRKLVPKLADAKKVYVEFNLQTKLAGSFEEQSDLLQRAIGGPYMTTNEGRSRMNMPAVAGGDELIRPLNVTQNGDQNPIPAETGEPPPDDPTEGEKTNGNSHRNGRSVHVLT